MLRFLCCLCCALSLIAAAEDATPQQVDEAVHLGIIPDTSGAAILDDTRGVLVKLVEAGNCAEDMGIKQGDIITHFNNQPILRIEDLKRALAASRVGNEATITVKRGNTVVDLKGELRAKLKPQTLEDKRETLKQLAEAGTKARNAKKNDLANNLRYLAVALNELPDRIEDAAHEFKKVYPKGEFTINIEIKISTNKNDAPATKIKLGEGGEVPAILKGAEEDKPEQQEAEDPPEVDKEDAVAPPREPVPEADNP